jgi:hypothetical protein
MLRKLEIGDVALDISIMIDFLIAAKAVPRLDAG